MPIRNILLSTLPGLESGYFGMKRMMYIVPILAGEYTQAECNSRYIVTINGKDFGECSFCRSSCPSRDLFKEPDSGIALKCDVCGEPMPEGGPMCVQWCPSGALTYAPERTQEIELPEEEEALEVEEL